MKRIKSLIIAICVLSGFLIFAATGYSGMGGSHHGANNRFDSRYGYNHSNGSHHDSNYNDHYRGHDNAQRYNRSNGYRSELPYGNHNDMEAEQEMNHGDYYIERHPDNDIHHRNRSVRER